MAIQKVRLSVEGLHCKHCADHLTSVLSLARGVKRASVDFAERQLDSVFDDDYISLERLSREAASIGFLVT